MRTRFGYLFGGFMIFFAFAVAGLAWISATSTMEGMQRVKMPGTAEVVLPAGPSSLYAESERDLAVDCKAAGLALRPPPQPVSYSLAGFRGRKVYDVDVVSGGKYDLACTGEAPFTIAIGAGVGAWQVIVVLAVVPLAIGLALVIATAVRRRRVRRAAAAG
ncbi:MAG: hypothetical protein ACM31C_33145 [Acidobacteriota bacterium]